jgi:NADH dehydrogenase FAD-containing subunit
MPKAWVKYTDIPALRAPSLSHVQGTVCSVDCERKIAVITDSITKKKYEESYDYLLCATGLRREWPTVPQSSTRDDYLKEAGDHIEKVKNAKEGVVVIGGGAVGIEMAAEIKAVEPTQKVTLIHSRDKLLSAEPLPENFKERVAAVVKDSGVEVILNDRVTDVKPVDSLDGSPLFNLTLQDGTKMIAGHVIWAISHSIPSTTYLPPSCLDDNKYVKVVPTMNFSLETPNSAHHFAIGDIASWTGIKRCGGAMFMGYTAAVNIHQQLLNQHFGTKPKFNSLDNFQAMIALAVGTQAVVYDPDSGINWGEDQMNLYFGKDLGWSSK